MIGGLLFDKDGTLFDFRSTWGGWTAQLLRELSDGDPHRAGMMADALGYDVARNTFRRDSQVIAGTPVEIGELLLPFLPGKTLPALVSQMNALTAEVPQVPALDLQPLLSGLKARGLRLGLATNDGEAAARAHLEVAGIAPLFDYVAGFDSGHGGKPHPGMLLAFARDMSLAPADVVMVGDSTHDLIAGRAAGMHVVAVLTGMATADELAPLAEIVLPDIGHLPAWLDSL